MFKKLCPKCNAIINATSRYCGDCTKKYKGQRHKIYDDSRKHDIYHAFYKSKEWKTGREIVLKKYSYIDLYELHINKRIAKANTVHHIIELREDYDKRLEIDNLFPCSSRTHNKIERMYKRDKKGTQVLLRKLLQKGLGG